MFRFLVIFCLATALVSLNLAQETGPNTADSEDYSESHEEDEQPEKIYSYACHKASVTFVEAFRLCMDDGLQLATDESSKDSRRLAKLLREKNVNEPVWIAGSDKGAENSWIWLSTMQSVGGIFNYLRWKGGEPTTGNHCMTAKLQGKRVWWQASSCSDKFCYVCQTFSNKRVDFSDSGE